MIKFGRGGIVKDYGLTEACVLTSRIIDTGACLYQGLDGGAWVRVVHRTEVGEVQRRTPVLPMRHVGRRASVQQHPHTCRVAQPGRLVE